MRWNTTTTSNPIKILGTAIKISQNTVVYDDHACNRPGLAVPVIKSSEQKESDAELV